MNKNANLVKDYKHRGYDCAVVSRWHQENVNIIGNPLPQLNRIIVWDVMLGDRKERRSLKMTVKHPREVEATLKMLEKELTK
jgi:hypothetical protein